MLGLSHVIRIDIIVVIPGHKHDLLKRNSLSSSTQII